MESYSQLVGDLGRVFNQLKQSVFQVIPNFIAALAIFILGWLCARLIRSLTERFITNLDHLIPNRTIQRRLQPWLRDKPLARIVSGLLFWILMFFFLTVATETLGLPVVTTWLSGITGYLPNLLVAVLIGMTGLVGGLIIRDVIITTTASAGITYGDMISRLAQVAILLITVLIGLEQLNIDLTLLTSLLTIATGALLFGGALAFGLGARTSVSNILASYYLQKTYAVGQRVKIGDVQGRILQITPIAVILEVPEGQIFVPAKAFGETISVLLTEGG